MNRFKHKKRNIFLICAVSAILIGFFVYTVIVGQNYTLIDVVGYNPVELSKVSVKSSDESVIKVTSVEQDKRDDDFYFLNIDLTSAGIGSCDINISYLTPGDLGEEKTSYKTEMTVLPFGIIYDTFHKSFTGMNIAFPLFLSIILIFLIVLSISFAAKLRAGDFSYSMVVLGGVILYLLLSFITILWDFSFWSGYGITSSISDIPYELALCGHNFLSITRIPMILLSISLAVSNVRLIIKEGAHLRNAFGIMLGFLLIGGMLALHFINSFYYSFDDSLFLGILAISLSLLYLLCYFECMLISTMICAIASTFYKPAQDMDYIIILGCAIRGDGTPTPLLRGRVQRAFEFEKAQYDKTGKHAKFVPSGGQGSNEVISEAESMKRCLMEMGVPEDRILKEDKSVNTLQNMAFSKKIIESDAGSLDNVNVGFSTTNYHVFRGYTLAQKVSMTVKGLSAKTKLYFFPNAFVREFIGLLWEKKLRHILFAFLIIIPIVSLYILTLF